MPHIVLTPEQARVVAGATENVEVRDPEGRTLALLTVLDSADAEALTRYRRNRDVPRDAVPSAQVQAHLRKLEEIRQREGLDEAQMLDLLRRLRAGEGA
jgi:hypothetical protein